MSRKQRVLYYRVAPHGYLVFTPPKRAEHNGRLHRALVESTTWGESRRRMRVSEYRTLFREEFSWNARELRENPGLREAGDDELFPHDVPGYCDGWHPPWIVQEQGQYLHADVFEKFGTDTDIPNGYYRHFSPANDAFILEVLRNRGYVLEHRGDLAFW
jgi:hypothetical protein